MKTITVVILSYREYLCVAEDTPIGMAKIKISKSERALIKMVIGSLSFILVQTGLLSVKNESPKSSLTILFNHIPYWVMIGLSRP